MLGRAQVKQLDTFVRQMDFIQKSRLSSTTSMKDGASSMSEQATSDPHAECQLTLKLVGRFVELHHLQQRTCSVMRRQR